VLARIRAIDQVSRQVESIFAFSYETGESNGALLRKQSRIKVDTRVGSFSELPFMRSYASYRSYTRAIVALSILTFDERFCQNWSRRAIGRLNKWLLQRRVQAGARGCSRANFNISASDLKPKRQASLAQTARGAKKCENFRIAEPPLLPALLFHTRTRQRRLPERDTRYHQRPDIISVGAYFRKWILWKQFLLF